jgi:hypothetical protein
MKNKINEEFKIYSKAANACIIKIESRAFPGILIQGDSLYNIYSIISDSIDLLKKSNPEEAMNLCEECQELLKGYLSHYENILTQNGFTIPYKSSDII